MMAKVPVRADGRYCDEKCTYLSDMRDYGFDVLCTLWLCKPKTCRPLRLSRDGRALRCAQCVRACK